MKKGDIIYWSYKGYPSDGYEGGCAATLHALFPGAKVRVYKTLQYFTQKGFGPGYYNSSWVYVVHFRSTLQRDLSEEEIAAAEAKFARHLTNMKRYSTEEEFKAAREASAKHARLMNKRNPY